MQGVTPTTPPRHRRPPAHSGHPNHSPIMVAGSAAAWLPLPCCILMQRGSPFPQRDLHRSMGQMKNRMLKLLLLLAAVAALAVAAPLVAPDFNTLDVSDLNASDNDASDLDPSDNDASDLDVIDADDLLEVSDENTLKRNADVVSFENLNTTTRDMVTTLAESGLVCRIDQYLDDINGTAQCTSCPSGHSVPYGDFQASDKELCTPCPFIMDSCARSCVTTHQLGFMQKSPIEQKPTPIEQKPTQTRQNTKNVAIKPNDKGIDMSSKTPYENKQIQKPAPTIIIVVKRETQIAISTETARVAMAVRNNLQMTSCASGTTCCLPGFYGASSASCTECPSNKPSSPFSAPNSACQCPNSASNKCFACNNVCRPYDSVSRMCVPYQCPSGQTCKVQSGAATCV